MRPLTWFRVGMIRSRSAFRHYPTTYGPPVNTYAYPLIQLLAVRLSSRNVGPLLAVFARAGMRRC